MSALDDYVYMLKQQGYSVMFKNHQPEHLIMVRLSKNGLNFQRAIPLDDISNTVLGLESVKLDVLMYMRKELDKELKVNENPRWTDYQVEALTYISESLTQYAYSETNTSLRTKLRSIATEVKNVIPMEMIKMKGEEK